jgi:hypothetical protein
MTLNLKDLSDYKHGFEMPMCGILTLAGSGSLQKLYTIRLASMATNVPGRRAVAISQGPTSFPSMPTKSR